jgi:hypothetical protein
MVRTKAAILGLTGLLLVIIAAGPIVRSVKGTYEYYGWKQYPPYRWRLTVELATPAGLRSYSGVYENQDSVAGPGMRFAPGSSSTCVQGDAIPIALDRRSTVYVLPWREDNWDWSRYAPQAILATPIGDHAKRALAMARLHGSAVLPRDNNRTEIGWPSFIRLPGKSGRALLPIVDPDHLGPGIRVARVTVSTTRDAVTRPLRPSIKKLLESLPAGTDSGRAEYLSQPTSSSC